MLLVADAGHPLEFRSCRLRMWDRLLAQGMAWSLDQKLAAGEPADSDARTAVRARVLVEPRRRETLARHWEHLMDAAARPGRTDPRDPRPPLCRERIRKAEPELTRMVALLRSAQPVPARGVALARLLLTDGAGPTHNRRNRSDLAVAARDVIRYLDPSTALVPAG
jgi:hypothetical protein